LALIWVCHVGGHAAVVAVADLLEDSEAGEVVGIDTPDLEDVRGAHALAVTFRFTTAVIDHGVFVGAKDGSPSTIHGPPDRLANYVAAHHARSHARRADQIGSYGAAGLWLDSVVVSGSEVNKKFQMRVK
jgi:hypothetical protein